MVVPTNVTSLLAMAASALLLTLAMASSLQVSRIVSVTSQCLLPNLA